MSLAARRRRFWDAGGIGADEITATAVLAEIKVPEVVKAGGWTLMMVTAVLETLTSAARAEVTAPRQPARQLGSMGQRPGRRHGLLSAVLRTAVQATVSQRARAVAKSEIQSQLRIAELWQSTRAITRLSLAITTTRCCQFSNYCSWSSLYGFGLFPSYFCAGAVEKI